MAKRPAPKDLAKETPTYPNLRRGNPGNKGGGRISEAYLIWLEARLNTKSSMAARERIMENPDHPQCLAAHLAAESRLWGKPKQDVGVTGGLTIRVVRK